MPRIPRIVAPTTEVPIITPLVLARGAGALVPLLQQTTEAAIEFREARDKAARVAELATHRRRLQTGLTKLQIDLEKGGDFAKMDENFAAQSSELYGVILEGIGDEDVRDAFTVHGTNSLSAAASQVTVNSYKLERDDGIARIDAGLNEYAQEIATATTQSQRDALGQAALDSINDTAYLTEQQKLKRIEDFQSDSDEQRVMSAARSSPRVAIAMVNDHDGTPGLTPLKRQQLIEAIETDGRIQEQAARARLNDKRTDTFGKMTDLIQSDEANEVPTRTDIINADLTAGQTKDLLFQLETISKGLQTPFNEFLATEMWDRTNNPKNQNQFKTMAELKATIYPLVNKGLDRPFAEKLEADFKRLQEPIERFTNDQFIAFYKRASVAIQGTGGILSVGLTEQSAKKFHQFFQMVEFEREKMRKAGENPVVLVTEGHKLFMGPRIDSYKVPILEQLTGELIEGPVTTDLGTPVLNAISRGVDVVPWEPGETAEEWVARDQANQ